MSQSDLRKLWNLDALCVFLNHGSYGACPGKVLDAQNQLRRRMEEDPVRFFQREYEELLAKARDRLSAFLGADPEGLVFVPNATTGVNTVLKSFPFSPGDEVIITDHIYNACKNALEFVANDAGVTVRCVHVPFPLESERVVEDLILGAITKRTRLVLIDHITSPTALIFPCETLARKLSAMGIHVLVDGAHAPGMVPLDLTAMGVSFYTGNCHKWLCAPKGAAFLYIREDMRPYMRPLVISHGANSTREDKSFLHLEFDWVGTSDYTPYLVLPDCLDFLDSLYPGGILDLMERNHSLCVEASHMLCHKFGVDLPCPENMIGSMASLPLLPLSDERRQDDSEAFAEVGSTSVPPQNPSSVPFQTQTEPKKGPPLDDIQDLLYTEFHIEVPIVSWPASGRRLVRISCQAYNQMQDYEALAQALWHILRP